MSDNHGNTPAAWTAVTVAMLGFVVGGVGADARPGQHDRCSGWAARSASASLVVFARDGQDGLTSPTTDARAPASTARVRGCPTSRPPKEDPCPCSTTSSPAYGSTSPAGEAATPAADLRAALADVAAAARPDAALPRPPAPA